jgi:hypothetical protein
MPATKSKQKAPERIIVCTDGHKPAIADWAKGKMKECDVEYVRADLVATPADAEQLVRLREAVEKALPYLETQATLLSYPHNKEAQNVATALRHALGPPRDERTRQCDYRSEACVNDGETVGGKWICRNHLARDKR